MEDEVLLTLETDGVLQNGSSGYALEKPGINSTATPNINVQMEPCDNSSPSDMHRETGLCKQRRLAIFITTPSCGTSITQWPFK
ncbi:hypothetical protein NHX12_010599 [Muraenolepis orangiensis]|uniref:Uncharacterized protein n=1 Tax=Muraenolepis orangiensis TaxID=630683 RepID=A0A9Q0DLI9_9TELE|nr:hypothetical protein NHX12_010599 [Muraenolepis orangiensis]